VRWLALELFRALQGVGGAALFATGTPLLRAELSGAALARALGAFGATLGGATAIGPLAGGVLTDTLGWRSIFFINLPIGAAAFAAGVARLRESRELDSPTDPTRPGSRRRAPPPATTAPSRPVPGLNRHDVVAEAEARPSPAYGSRNASPPVLGRRTGRRTERATRRGNPQGTGALPHLIADGVPQHLVLDRRYDLRPEGRWRQIRLTGRYASTRRRAAIVHSQPSALPE
jgi:hypothetical protein